MLLTFSSSNGGNDPLLPVFSLPSVDRPRCAGEVAAVGATELQRVLGDEEGWKAWEKSNGVDRDPVKARSAPKSIGCSKTFPGKAKLT